MYLPLSPDYSLPTLRALEQSDAPLPPAKRLRTAVGVTDSSLPVFRALLNKPPIAATTDHRRQKSSKPTGSEAGDTRRRRTEQPAERRREQCRANQQRYRDKQKFAVLRLEADILELREQIKWQEFARDAMSMGVDPSSTIAARMVKHYFGMVRFGLSGASLALPIRLHRIEQLRPGSSSISNAGANASLLMPTGADEQVARAVLPQLAFLKAMFADDVEASGVKGLEAFVELLWRYSCYFSSSRWELEQIQVRRQPKTQARSDLIAVVATAQLSFTISPATMTYVFPHLEEEVGFASRLLGKKLEVACEVTFAFERRGPQFRVTSCNMKLDMISALRTVLDRMGDVAAVLGQAHMTSEGVIGDMGSFP